MSCLSCLCHVCNKVQCPKGKYHCLPCRSGVVLDCDFFNHRNVSKIYHIKPQVSDAHLILDKGSLRSSLEWEQMRHRQAVRDIVSYYKNKDKNATK